jgi:hypothetical protein
MTERIQPGNPGRPNQKWKRPNAYKHGVFSGIFIVPGEDPQEFQQLVDDLIEEWQPSGATEEDAVLSIAKCMWLRRRAAQFLDVQSTMNRADPNHAAYDECVGLVNFVGLMQDHPETCFMQYAHRCLRPDRIKYLQEKFLRHDFQSASEWAQAMVNHIMSVLLPPVTISDQNEGLKRWKLLVQSAANFSGDLFDQELTLDERLNAMIDRATKRLIHIKAMKQMLSQVHKQQQNDQVRKLPVREESNGAMKSTRARP